MKVTKINSNYTSTNIVTSADVNLRNVDAKFLFHAIRRIQSLWDVVYSNESEETRQDAINEIHKLQLKVNGMLLPIAEQILVPVEDIDAFLEEFNIEEDRSEKDMNTIRKSKGKSGDYAEVSSN